MTKITSPVEGFTGKTSFGPLEVEFEDGKATVEDLPDGIRAYMLRTGYKVGSKQGEAITTLDGNSISEQPVDSRGLSVPQVVGTPLRDAAVDPKSEDFLAPTNAGEADPHGPEVVSPEVHASQGVRPVKGGEVHVDDADAQDAAEKAHTEAVANGQPIEGITVPDGDLDARVGWASEAETAEERTQRAQALYDHAKEAGDTDLQVLSGRLTAAVYGQPEPPEELKGQALEDALEERGLPKSGTADEKRARVSEHDAAAKGQG